MYKIRQKKHLGISMAMVFIGSIKRERLDTSGLLKKWRNSQKEHETKTS